MNKEPDRRGPDGIVSVKPRGWASRSAASAVLLLAALGVLAWRHPLWLLDRLTDIRLRLHGVRSEYVIVDGYKIHYLAGGAGKPLVLVHGLGSRATDWSALIPQFIRGGYRVYALDLLGYGFSQRPPDVTYSIPVEAAIVQGFLDSQHLSRVDLAGWSMGGWIAMRVALNHPARIRKLVLLDSAGLRFKLAFDPALFEPDSPRQMAALQQLLEPPTRVVPPFLIEAILRRGRQLNWVVRRSMDSMIEGRDLLDGKLASLTMPVLIGWGKEDRLIPLAIGYRLHAQIPQSVLAVYAGCGHLAPGLCASEVGPNVVDFLNAEPPPKAEVQEIGRAR